MPVSKASDEGQKRRALRATEWKKFRRDFLFSQRNLAEALHCARRTIVAIEGRETTDPHPDLLRRFRDLKRKCEKAEVSTTKWPRWAA